MSTMDLLRIGLKEGDCDRRTLRNDREELAARQGEDERVCFGKSRIAPRLFIEERLVAKIIASAEFAKRLHPLIDDLDGSLLNEIDPVSDLSRHKDFFSRIKIIFTQFFSNGKEEL